MSSCRQVQQEHRYGSQYWGLLPGWYSSWCDGLSRYLVLGFIRVAKLCVFFHIQNISSATESNLRRRSTRRGRVTCSLAMTACSTCWCSWGWVSVIRPRENILVAVWVKTLLSFDFKQYLWQKLVGIPFYILWWWAWGTGMGCRRFFCLIGWLIFWERIRSHGRSYIRFNLTKRCESLWVDDCVRQRNHSSTVHD